MLKILAVIVAITGWQANANSLSAHRDKDTDFREYLPPQITDADVTLANPEQMAVPLAQLDTSKLVDWTTMATTETGFERLRDDRFITDDAHPGSLRRDTWLYPDDGCYARAALAKQNLKKWGYQPVKKIFAFGNLVVKTANSPQGQVSWWYHVVNGVRIGDKPYVLDPAIEPQNPLPLSEWVDRMGGDKASITLSICADGTYAPQDPCLEPSQDAEANALTDQTEFLGIEWNRLTELNRDPSKELGDQPPWPLKPTLVAR